MSWKNLLLYFRPKSKTEQKIKNIVGFYPNDVFFYEQAFIHKSISNQDERYQKSNERLEFLGDAVLNAVVSDFLFTHHPGMKEGALSALRSKMVSRESLNEIALKMKLETHLISNLPNNPLNTTNSLPGNTLEALIGAVYLDQGYQKCKIYILEQLFKLHLDLEALIHKEVNHKSRILEWGQKNRKLITFELISEDGIGIQKQFTMVLKIDNEVKSSASASSKKKAEQIASEQFLLTLQHG